VIRYRCACGKVCQSDDSAAGGQVRCLACGGMLTVPDSTTVSFGAPEGEVALSPGCPVCEQQFQPGQVVCIACGYDTVTGRKIRTDMGEEPPVAEPPARKRRIQPGVLPTLVALAAVILLMWAVIHRTDEPVRSLDEDKQIIRDHVAKEIDGTGYEVGEFVEAEGGDWEVRFTLQIVDAAGLEVGRAAGTLDREADGKPTPRVIITYD